MQVHDLCAFIRERESIRLKRERGWPRPWTDDEILNTYRFCNVRRNDDTVTKWIHENWITQAQYRLNIDDTEELWFAMFVARLVNKPDSLMRVEPYVIPFHEAGMRKAIRSLRNHISPAYKVMSPIGAGFDQAGYIVDVVLHPLWESRERLRPTKFDSLDAYHMTLCQFPGVGSFLAAQVIADLKYTEPLRSAPDWAWWAASGPGSRRGLVRITRPGMSKRYNETHWRHDFHILWLEVNKTLNWDEPLTGQDLQNCLCEFDKYERARLGEGRPKQLYKES